jgi:hypothetical protein
MSRKYPYSPSFDGKASQPGTKELVRLCGKRWGTKNLGIYNNRLMRNDKTVGKKIGDPGMEKYLSVHATGAAADIGYPSEAVAKEMWEWFLTHSKALGICGMHWYAWGDYGAGYKCSRGEGLKGVVIFTKTNNAGSYQGNPMWLHIEISPEMAADAKKFRSVWMSLPKPGGK